MSSSHAWLAAAALALTAAVAGCGAAGPGSDMVVAERVASAGTERDAYAAFADCMRKRGFHVEVLPGGGVKVGGGPDGQLDAATRACSYVLPAAHHKITPAEAARFRAEMLTFTRCIRSHGVDVPDPKFAPLPGGFDVYYPRKPGEPPPQADPKWPHAEAACRHLNPLLRGHD
jgi:hypothetical protein